MHDYMKSKQQPPCTVTRKNEPNFELMAKALLDYYYETNKIEKKNIELEEHKRKN